MPLSIKPASTFMCSALKTEFSWLSNCQADNCRGNQFQAIAGDIEYGWVYLSQAQHDTDELYLHTRHSDEDTAQKNESRVREYTGLLLLKMKSLPCVTINMSIQEQGKFPHLPDYCIALRQNHY